MQILNYLFMQIPVYRPVATIAGSRTARFAVNPNRRIYAGIRQTSVKTRNTFNDIIDWRMFFVHTIGENVKRRFEVAKVEDQGKHPLMCHHVFIQGFPVTSTASDPWNVGRFGDLHGLHK